MTPIYDNTSWQKLIDDSSAAHPGLLFDRYPDGWEITSGGKVTLPTGAKENFLIKIIRKYKENDPSLALKNALARRNRLVENILGGATIEVQTDWRFVSGLGSGHPYETGFTWHRTLAVPYLPGASVKGMMRAWAEQWVEDESIKEAVTALFGPEEKSPENAAGSLIVFDALPLVKPVIEIDILNPHYKDYYENSDKTPPADYLNPVPVFFLAVAPKQGFSFSIAPRPKAHDTPEQAADALQQGIRLLKDALSTIGAGGKTAVGYGTMTETPASEKRRLEGQRKKQKQMEEKSRREAVEQDAAKTGYQGLALKAYRHSRQEDWEKNYERYSEAVDQWLPLMAQEQDTEIRKQCIDLFAGILDQKYPGIMRNPDKTKGRRNKLCYPKPRSREIAKRLIELSDGMG